MAWAAQPSSGGFVNPNVTYPNVVPPPNPLAANFAQPMGSAPHFALTFLNGTKISVVFSCSGDFVTSALNLVRENLGPFYSTHSLHHFS